MKKLFLVLTLALSQNAISDDGVFAINEVCDGFGCFLGDTGGFPITITASGSYQLTSNITSTSTSINAIEINADNVTLDLNGFTITGPRTCTGDNATLVCTNTGMTAHGISAVGRKSLVVKNGAVKGYDTGVSMTGANSRGNLVKNITASESEFGVTVVNGMISDSAALRNLDTGFYNTLLSNLFLKDSYATGNKVYGASAYACSNVYLTGNGNNNCLVYINESYCDGSVCP